MVKDKLDESRAEFSHLEEAVEEQMSTKPKKRRKSGGNASSPASSAANMGVAEYLGGLPDNFNIEDLGSDSDDSLLLDL